MPHDKHSRPIKVGDLVMLPCVVKSINVNPDYCNVCVESFYPMYPTEEKRSFALNGRMLEFVADSNDAEEAGEALFNDRAE